MNIEHIAQHLGLKKYGVEQKGPCPVCGGKDRFWMKPGRSQPVIFGCRQGCGFSDIMRELESRGLVERERLSKDEIKKRRIESPVAAESYIYAMMVIDQLTRLDDWTDDDVRIFANVIKVIKKAKDFGIQPLPTNWAWDFAVVKERGLIHESN
jgi:hypothetical protein